MEYGIFFIIIGITIQPQSTSAIWSCSLDSECSSLTGSICVDGSCICAPGQQPVLGGTICADVAPYFTSPCLEDHQCFRLFNNYECQLNNNDAEGTCGCKPDHHYFRGRCWSSSDYGDACSRDEECLGAIRDPYSMVCNGTCTCADGYYLRQRGECRKMGLSVGDGCVLNEDCQFPDGACDQANFVCYDVNDQNLNETTFMEISNGESNGINMFNNMATVSKQNGSTITCGANDPCSEPFECSPFGVCICPLGYYSEENTTCLAELSSPATEDQCKGLLATVVNGVCTCPPNFFFDVNMRDCVRVTRRISESCISDLNCHTFGAASRCGPPQEPWGVRTCECIPELAVWDSSREMCRLFAGLGETCEVDSDCLAGELEIQCVKDQAGQGYCTCPEGLEAVDGLCLTTGLELGETCQVSAECTGTQHTVCEGGRCSCGDGYQETGNICAPVIGGTCNQDTDCAIPDTVCQNNDGSLTCQCKDAFVEYKDECWLESEGYGTSCNVTAQCTQVLGTYSSCIDGRCGCSPSYHYKDGSCWPMTGLFEACSRSSECFLLNMTDRVVCRNGLCQCDFNFPYSEELHTCTSSARRTTISFVTIATSLIYFVTS